MTDTTKNTLDSTQNIKSGCNDAFISKISPGQNIIGNTTTGQQQFTILADTQHGNPLITKAILDAIPSMAQAGVKHLMLEFAPDPEIQIILDRLYQIPPQITAEEIREKAYLFESLYGTQEKERQQDSQNYVEIIIQAQKHSIQLHFAGDDLGYAESTQMSLIEEEQNKLINQSPLLQKYLQSTEKKYNDLDQNTKSLVNKIEELAKEWIDTQKTREEERMGFEAEESRAERFIILANGEKAVIIFGQGHVDSKNDINEIIDQKLHEQAIQNGSTEEPKNLSKPR